MNLEEVADKLALSPPMLRRRLAAEGHSFQGLKDSVRRDAAIEELQRRDATLEQIAALLGFSEVSTFHRAFKKWTGLAPGDYRRTRS
jgi:AraC-like DNA-binding protein